MYEHKSQTLLSRRLFVRRVVQHTAMAASIVAFSIGIGVVGFHACGKMPWLDAFENTSMLLGGMGPVGSITSASGKWFSSFYALYAGLVFIAVSTIITAPVLHRILHRLHLDDGS